MSELLSLRAVAEQLGVDHVRLARVNQDARLSGGSATPASRTDAGVNMYGPSGQRRLAALAREAGLLGDDDDDVRVERRLIPEGERPTHGVLWANRRRSLHEQAREAKRDRKAERRREWAQRQ